MMNNQNPVNRCNISNSVLTTYSVVYNIERDISQNRRVTYTAMLQLCRRVIDHFSPVINNKVNDIISFI